MAPLFALLMASAVTSLNRDKNVVEIGLHVMKTPEATTANSAKRPPLLRQDRIRPDSNDDSDSDSDINADIDYVNCPIYRGNMNINGSNDNDIAVLDPETEKLVRAALSKDKGPLGNFVENAKNMRIHKGRWVHKKVDKYRNKNREPSSFQHCVEQHDCPLRERCTTAGIDQADLRTALVDFTSGVCRVCFGGDFKHLLGEEKTRTAEQMNDCINGHRVHSGYRHLTGFKPFVIVGKGVMRKCEVPPASGHGNN